MKKYARRCIALLLTWLLLLSMLPTSIFAFTEKGPTAAAAALVGGMPFVSTTLRGATQSGACGENLTWSFDGDSGVLTITGSGRMEWEDQFSPDSAPWNSFKESILTVDLPEGLTNIVDWAFYGLCNLTEVSLPSTLQTIGSSAFCACSKLKEIRIPDSVNFLGSYVFTGCTSLETAMIGRGINALADGMFNLCTSLKEIVIPAEVSAIGADAFRDCSALQDITISGNVKTIGREAFFSCTGLKSVTFCDGVETIGEGAFGICFSLTEVVLPESVTALGKDAFGDCYALKDVTVLNSDMEIGYDAFGTAPCEGFTIYGYSASTAEEYARKWPEITFVSIGALQLAGECGADGDNLRWAMDTETGVLQIEGSGAMQDWEASEVPWRRAAGWIALVRLPEGLTSIGANAFRGCAALTSVAIPESVHSIGDYAFCESGLTEFPLGSNVERIGERVFRGCAFQQLTIPSGVTEIGWGAFASCKQLERVTFPETLTSIGDYAFSGCELIEAVVLPNAVTSIGSNAFQYCNSLTEITLGAGVEEDDLQFLHNGCPALQQIYVAQEDQALESVNGVLFNREKTELLCYPRGRTGAYSVPEGVSRIGAYAFYQSKDLSGVEFPAQLQEIGPYAFFKCGLLTSLSLPDRMTTVGRYAFAECCGLLNVDLNGANTIESFAFSNCFYLERLRLGDGVCSIGDSAFSFCTSLTELTLPDSLTSLGSCAFQACWVLTSLDLGNSLQSIGDSAFSSCAALSALDLGNSLQSIGKSAFSGCESLTELTLPDSLTSLGSCAFQACLGLTSLRLGSGLKEIERETFWGCEGLTELIVPDGVAEIGDSAFWCCSGLTSITFGSGLLAIGEMAFYGCCGLSELTLPESVRSIESNAFLDCGLTSVTLGGQVAVIGVNAFGELGDPVTIYGYANGPAQIYAEENGFLFVPIGTAVYSGVCGAEGENLRWTLDTGTGALRIEGSGAMQDMLWGSAGGSAWKSAAKYVVTVQLPEGLTSVGSGAFYNCTALQSVNLPETVEEIGEQAFFGCTGLRDLKLENGLSVIGDSAFSGCTSLESVMLPDTVTAIGYNSFMNCSGIRQLSIGCGLTDLMPGFYQNSFIGCDAIELLMLDMPTVPDWFAGSDIGTLLLGEHVRNISPNAFRDCAKLSEVAFSDGMLSIGENAFTGCSLLTTLDFGNGLQSIGQGAFSGCSALRNLTISDSVAEIGDAAFENCISLSSVSFGAGLLRIPDSAFRGCTDLAQISIPDNVLWIDRFAFADCTALRLLELGDGLQGIGISAFQNCGSLASVSLPEGLSAVNSAAFSNCSSLEVLTLPSSLAEIGSNAFFGCGSLQTVYYGGTQEMWETVNVYSGNDALLNAEIHYSNSCGNGLTWSLSESGVLVINGNGELPDYPKDQAPWHEQAESVLQIRLAATVTGVGSYAFQDCVNAISVEFGNGLTKIGDYAFWNCASLQKLRLPPLLTEISDGAFSGCRGLTEVTLPERVINVGSRAFFGCTSLECVTLDAKIRQLGDNAFDGCSLLTGVYFRGKPLALCGNDPFGPLGGDLIIYYYDSGTEWDEALVDGGWYLGYHAFPINALQEEQTITTDRLFYIKVVDSGNNGLSGAIVSIGDTVYTTNEKGFVSLLKPEGVACLEISCSHHNTFIDRAFAAGKAGLLYIAHLTDSPSTVQGVRLNGESIATSYQTVNCNSAENLEITVIGDSKYPIVKYELLQGSRLIAEVKTEEKECTFRIRADSLEEGKNVFVRMHTSNDGAVSAALYLDVIHLPKFSSFPVIDDTGFGSIIASLGSLGMVDLPFNFREEESAQVFVVEKGRTVRIGFNIDPSEIEENSADGTNAFKKAIEKKINECLKLEEAFFHEKKFESAFKLYGYVEIEYIGDGQCYVKEECIKGLISLKASFNCSLSYFGIVGITLKASISGEFGLQLSIECVTPESGFSFKEASLPIKLKVGLQLDAWILFGAGSAGFYGDLTLNGNFQLAPKFGFTKVTLDGELGIRWQVCWFFRGQYKIASGRIWEWEAGRAIAHRNPMGMTLRDAYMDPANYTLQDRAYLALRSDWEPGQKQRGTDESNGENEDLQKNTYEGIAPRIATAGNSTVMVWLDDNPARDLDSFQTLYYSVYDEMNRTWSEPIQLDRNETLDCEFDLISYNDRIYVAYTEQSAKVYGAEQLQVDDAAALADYFRGIELSVAVFENGKFSEPIRLTENAVSERYPAFGTAGGKLALTWIETDRFGTADTGSSDRLCRAIFTDGAWQKPAVVAEQRNPMIGACCGELNGKGCLAYLLDSDGDTATSDDIALVLNGEDTDTVIVDTGEIRRPVFVELNGQAALLWQSSGTVKLLRNAAGEPEILCKDLGVSVCDFRVARLGGQTLLTFLANTEDGSDVFSVALNEGDSSEIPVRLTVTNGYVGSYAAEEHDGTLLIAFTEITPQIDDNAVNTSTDFRWTRYTPQCDLSMTEIHLNEEELRPGAMASVAVELENCGMIPVDGLQFTLFDPEGVSVCQSDAAVALKPGENSLVNLTLPLPTQLQRGEYTLQVLASQTGADRTIGDNSMPLTLAYSDLSVKMEEKLIDNQPLLLLFVSNFGNTETDAELSLCAGARDGRLIDSISLGTVRAGELRMLTVELSGLISEEESVIVCSVIAKEDDPYSLNNTDAIHVFRVDAEALAETEEEKTENPLLQQYEAVYDRYTEPDIRIIIEAGAEHFSGINGLAEGEDYLLESNVITLQRGYLQSLQEQTELELMFVYQGFEPVIRRFTVSICDSAPILLNGHVLIAGEPIVGATVTADLSGLEPSDAEIAFEWSLDGSTVGTSRGFVIPLDAGEKTLTLSVEGRNGYIGELSDSKVVQLQPQPVPSVPILLDLQDTSFALIPVSGVEYSLDNETWQSNPAFSGLTPGRTYTVYARYARTEVAAAGETVCLLVTTKVPLQSIAFDRDTVTAETADGSIVLTLSFTPANATEQTILWQSSDEAVALVTDGVVTLLRHGVVTITATSKDGGFTASCVLMILCSHLETEQAAYLPSTCTENGHEAYTVCLECGAITEGSDEALPLAAHQYAELAEEQYLLFAATCKEPAVYCKSCSACGARSEETFQYGAVDLLNHVGGTHIENAQAPTCFSEGYSGDTVCDSCHVVLLGGTVIEKTDHSAAEPVEENREEPTCTEAGGYDMVVSCTVCGAELSREHTEIPALGHDYRAVVTAPTPTEGGYTTWTCSRCKDSYVDSYTDPLGYDYTVTFSVLGDTGVIAPMVCNTVTGITLPDAEAPAGYRFLGWVEQDCDNVTDQPETVLTGAYTAESDVKLLALFTYNDYGGNPPTLELMTAEDTFSDGDKIVIVESGGVHGLYQKAHNYAYVSDFAFTEDAEAILADELKYFNVTEVDGGWYLGDETNGWLYTPDNQTNLTIRYNTAFMTAFTLTTLDGHLALQHTVSYNDNVFYVNCGTNLTGALTNKWRMVNANNMSGISTLDIYKLHEGGPAVAHYTTVYVPPHVHTPGEAVEENRVEPTCETAGGYDTVIYCAECGEELSRTHTELQALGHDWNEPTYVWAEDNSTVTAARTCKRDESHVETETVNTTAVTQAATVDEEGQTVYTAVFENEAFETQTKTVILPKLDPTDPCADGHDWDAPSYAWAEDNSTVTATRVCKNNAEHAETETVATTSEVTKPATYEQEGEITLTAVFENPAFETQTKKVAIPKLERSNPFEDVAEGAYYYEPVLWAVNHDPQITNGTSATTFSPNATCTRAQVVTFLWRAKGCPEPTKTDNPFTDVKEGTYYFKAVLWAVENGITNGTSATTFSPNNGCTRAQVVTFLWRTEGKPAPTSTDNPFTDVTGGYYYDAVLWAVENKITNGTSATTFGPNATCTRAQIVTFLYRDLTK